MFTFAEHTRFYRLTGLGLLLCALNVFIAGMPPFQAGIWVQTEPAIFILYICAALTGIWLALGIGRRWLVPCPAFSPLLLCFLLWIAWQIAVTSVVAMPWRSWFGPPQTGDGTGISIATLLTVMLAYPLWESLHLRRILMAVTGLSLFVQCALHVYYPEIPGNPYMPERWVPAQWPEYLPFLGGYMWVAAFAGGYIGNWKRYAWLAIGMVALLADSLNKSAIGLFAVALFFTTLVPFIPLPRNLRCFFYPSPAWRKTMIAACALPFTLALASPIFPMLHGDRDPTGILRVFSHINDGIGSRLVMDQVSLSVLRHEPELLLVGTGWGCYTDDLFKYALVDGVYTYKNGMREPNWFLVDGSSHHSHNQPMEALLSMGLIGMALWYALPMLSLWTLPKCQFWKCAPMIVAITGLGHFWFQLPQCFPYQALYITALMSICTKKTYPSLVLKRSHYGILFTLVVSAMAWSAVEQYTIMMHADRVHDASFSGSYKDYSEEWLAQDLRYGGDRWLATTRFISSDVPAQAEKNGVTDNMVGWYTYFMHTAHLAAVTPAIGPRVSSMELRVLYYLFSGFDSHMFDQLRHEATVSFEDAAMRMIAKAPLRDDFTSYFLTNLAPLVHNNVTEEIRILNRVLSIAPDHRGALWLLGNIYLTTPGREQEGRNMLKKAISTHAERVYPITDEELQAASNNIIH